MKPIWITTAALAAILAACSQPEAETEAPAEAGAPAEAEASPAQAPAEQAPADAAPEADRLAAVLADPRRDNDRARDQFRNPAATVEFFEIEPNHAVVEALPGGGWYTRVLAPYVAGEGQYMAINYPMAMVEELWGDQLTDAARERMAERQAAFPGQVESFGGSLSASFFFGEVPAEVQGQADRVLYIRALHNLARAGRLEQAAQDAFNLLKAGGVAGIVQHRAQADASDEYADGSNGYLREADVVAAFEAAGFELVESSAINANPNDTADHQQGVWGLPPTNGGDSEGEDVPPLQSVGESDRMTLKFRKPA